MIFTQDELKVMREAMADYKNKLVNNTDGVTIGTRDGYDLLEIYQQKFKTAQSITIKIELDAKPINP